MQLVRIMVSRAATSSIEVVESFRRVIVRSVTPANEGFQPDLGAELMGGRRMSVLISVGDSRQRPT